MTIGVKRLDKRSTINFHKSDVPQSKHVAENSGTYSFVDNIISYSVNKFYTQVVSAEKLDI